MVAAPRYIVDEQGNCTEVIFAIADYEALLDALEEADDIRAYDAAKAANETPVPFEQAWDEIESGRVPR